MLESPQNTNHKKLAATITLPACSSRRGPFIWRRIINRPPHRHPDSVFAKQNKKGAKQIF